MCLTGAEIPLALGVAAAVTAAAGTAATVVGQIQQTNAANSAARYNAAILDRNAQIANQQAAAVEQQGAIDEKQQRLRVAALTGTQRAAYGGSGLLVDEGTPLDVTRDTAGYGELDALTIRRNAGLDAWGIRNQGSNFQAQASLARSSQSSPWLSAGGSLLTGASSMAQQLYGYNRSGVFSSGRPSSIPATPYVP